MTPPAAGGGDPSTGNSILGNFRSAVRRQAAIETDMTPGVGTKAAAALVTGGLKSIFESKDALLGETPKDERSGLRKTIESTGEELANEGWGYGLAIGVGQFATAFVGVGKLIGAAKAIPAIGSAVAGLGTTGRVAIEVGRGAAAANLGFDPHDARLSNLIESNPALTNPVTRFLQADPNDSTAMARLKLSLEGIGMDMVAVGVLAATLKGFRALKGGDNATAEVAADEVQALLAEKDNAVLRGEEGGGVSPGAGGDGSAAPPAASGTPAAEAGGTGQAVTAGGQAPRLVRGTHEDMSLPVPPEGLDDRVYKIESPEGETIGYANIRIDGEVADVRDLYTILKNSPEGARGVLGTSSVSQMLRQFLAENPQVKRIMGERVSGARNGGQHSLAGEGQPVDIGVAGRGPKVEPVAEGVGPAQAVRDAGAEVVPAVKLQEFTSEQVESILQKSADDTDALLRSGSYEAAVAANHVFAPNVLLPKGLINTEELAAFAGRLAEGVDNWLASAKGGDANGILKDARVQRMVSTMISTFGEDPALVLGMLQRKGAEARPMVAQMLASRALALHYLQEAYRAAMQMRVGNFAELGGSKPAAEEALKTLFGLASSTAKASRSMTTSAARTLRLSGAKLLPSEADMAKLAGMDPAALAEVLAATGGNPRALVKATSGLAKLIQGMNFILINGILAGPKTHIINAISNAAMLALRPGLKVAGSYWLDMRGKIGGSTVRREAVLQYRYMASVAYDSWDMAMQTLRSGDSVLTPHDTKFNDPGAVYLGTKEIAQSEFVPLDSAAAFARNTWVGMLKLMGSPTRLLGMEDEVFKQIIYRSKVLAKATVDAEEQGLTGEAFQEFVKKRVDEAFGPDGEALDARALREAKEATFTQELGAGTFGNSVAALPVNHPAIRVVLTFMRTPINILRAGWDFTPGLNRLHRQYNDALHGLHGPEAQAYAAGQMMLGSAVMAGAAAAALNGRITGGGPPPGSPGRDALMASGWKPYSFVMVNEDGSRTYIPLNRFDPLAIPLGIVADLVDISQHPEKHETIGDVTTALVAAVSSNFTSKSYLTGIDRALTAIMDPSRAGWALGSLAGSFVPFSALVRSANENLGLDPYMRDVRTVVDGIMAVTPGLSKKLPARYDAFGEPVLVRNGLWSNESKHLADQELARLAEETGASIGVPGPIKMGADLRDIKTVDGKDAYARYQELAGRPDPNQPSLKEAVADLVESEQYLAAYDGPDDADHPGSRLALINTLVKAYRDAGFSVLMEDPNVSGAVQDALIKRAQTAAGEAPDNGYGSRAAEALGGLMRSFGLGN